MAGKLIIVGMPIGNFGDFSSRALEALKSCELIICEDTRSNKLFLQNFNINKMVISYIGSLEKALYSTQKTIENNQNVALICDRGMPGVCDPGAKIVDYFRKINVQITCVPGPSALTTAFALSGYFGSFVFHGFLPRKSKDILELVENLSKLDYNLIFFESPNRMSESLKILSQILKGREITIARELTKVYEEVIQGKIEDLINREFKGECVLIIKKLKN